MTASEEATVQMLEDAALPVDAPFPEPIRQHANLKVKKPWFRIPTFLFRKEGAPRSAFERAKTKNPSLTGLDSKKLSSVNDPELDESLEDLEARLRLTYDT